MYRQNTVTNRRFIGATLNYARREVPSHLPRPAPIRVQDPTGRFLAICDGYQGYPGKKGGSTGYDGYKKVNGNKLSALVDRNGLPLACTVAPANVYDSRLYEPTLEAFEAPDVQDRSSIISADGSLRCLGDSSVQPEPGNQDQYLGQQGIPEHPKRGRPILFDLELYKRRSAVGRFFSWIEAFKKIFPCYERYKHSFWD